MVYKHYGDPSSECSQNGPKGLTLLSNVPAAIITRVNEEAQAASETVTDGWKRGIDHHYSLLPDVAVQR